MSRSLNPGYTKYNSHLFLFYNNIFYVRLFNKKLFKKLSFFFYNVVSENLKTVITTIFYKIFLKLFGFSFWIFFKNKILTAQNSLLIANYSIYKKIVKRQILIPWVDRTFFCFPFIKYLRLLPVFLRYKVTSTISFYIS